MRQLKLIIAALFLISPFAANADVIYFDDFEGGSTALTGAGGITAAGGFSGTGAIAGSFFRNSAGGNPAGTTSLVLGGIGSHSMMTVDFDFLAIDSWDGSTGGFSPDFFNLVIDSGSVFSLSVDRIDQNDGTISTFAGATLISSATDLGFNTWWDTVYHVSVDVAHSADGAILDFFASGTGWQGGFDESWAIDNLSVSVDSTPVSVPEPGTLALFGIGLFGMGLARRRKKT